MTLQIRRPYYAAGIAALLVLSLLPFFAHASLPQGFSVETVVQNLNLPTTFDFASDGRIFIAEKDGMVRVFQNGQLLPTPFITLSDINTFGDRGLIGFVLDPNFTQNGWVYLSYTYENDPNNYQGPKTGRIVRVQADGNVADLSTFEVLVGTEGGSPSQPSCKDFAITEDCIFSDSSSHSVGGLRFGPDGKLYAELGDGAGFTDVDPFAENAQDLDALAGKMLRLNPDGTAPSDNPYFTGDADANRSKVFAYGQRNSYRFDFRPATGALYAGDVGWGTWEEINIIEAGGNYAWPCKEGSFDQDAYTCTASGPGPVIDPMYEYPRGSVAAAVVGGSFTGNAYPSEYQDDYIYGDFHRGQIIRMQVDQNDEFVSQDIWLDGDAAGPVSILTSPAGEVHFISIFTGEIRKIVHEDSGSGSAPTARIDASPESGAAPLSVDFDGGNSSDPDGDALSYSWNFRDGGTDEGETVSHTYTDPGTYTAELTVLDSDGNFDADTVTVVVTSGGTSGEADPSHESTTVSKANAVVGDIIDIESLIRNSGTGGNDPFIVDFEIYDVANGNRVDSDVLEISIPGGSTDTAETVWIPQASGTYRISVGLFSFTWSTLYEWVDAAVFVTVTDRLPDDDDDQDPPSGNGVVLYDDALGVGVDNWSWDGDYDLASTGVTAHSGSESIRASYTAPWSGLYLHTIPTSASGLGSLNLALHGGQTGGQQLQVVGFGAGGAVTGRYSLTNLSTSWTTFSISLADLGLQNGTIEGIALQGASGLVEAPFYVDTIELK